MYRYGCAHASDAGEMMAAAYQHAADQGDPEAQVALSALYFEGNGLDQSFYRAYQWARLAERRLPPCALRASATEHREKAARMLPAFELQDVERFVDEILRASAIPMR
jgi:TPR repeat protein